MIKVNWDKLPAQANYVAMTDGYWHWFSEKPTYDADDSFWFNEGLGSWGAVPLGTISYSKDIHVAKAFAFRRKIHLSKRKIL